MMEVERGGEVEEREKERLWREREREEDMM